MPMKTPRFDVAVMGHFRLFVPGVRAETAEEAATLCRGPAISGDEIIVTPAGGGTPESFEVYLTPKGRPRVRRRDSAA